MLAYGIGGGGTSGGDAAKLSGGVSMAVCTVI